MTLPFILAGVAAAAQAANSYTQGKKAAKDTKNAQKRLDAIYSGIPIPEQTDLDLQEADYAGDVDPRLVDAGADVTYTGTNAQTANAALAGDSAMGGIQTDPRLRDAQLSALLKMQEVSSGGFNAEDKANLARSQSQAAQADRGRREAIMQNMAARGMSGSGNDLLSQLQSSQAATDRQSQEGLDINAMAQRRALEAMMQSGQMSGNMRSQEFGEKSSVAQAQDAISKFNAANTQNANQFNAGAMNQNAQFNAGNQLRTDTNNRDSRYNASTANANAQNTAATGNRNARQDNINNNTRVRNMEIDANNQATQRDFDNQMTRAAGQSGAARSGMEQGSRNADRATDAMNNAIQGAGTIAAAYYANETNKNKNKKKDEE